jgi:hypothetical protein
MFWGHFIMGACRSRVILLAVAVCGGMSSGCGGVSDAPETVPVSGTVTYNGNAVPRASLTFAPDGVDKSGIAGTGATDANGAFEAKTSQSAPGLMPGEYKVIVQAFKRMPAEIPPSELAKMKKEDNLAVPVKYTDKETTDAKITVGPEGSTSLNIELKD